MKKPDDHETGGVLAGLPSTRPQRRSAKRDRSKAAATTAPGRRTGGSAKAGGATAGARRTTAGPGKAKSARPTGPATKARTKSQREPVARAPAERATPEPGRRREPAPIAAQGFEPDKARGPVEPPSKADVLGSVVEGVGELAHVGLALSRQLVRAALGRLPGA